MNSKSGVVGTLIKTEDGDRVVLEDTVPSGKLAEVVKTLKKPVHLRNVRGRCLQTELPSKPIGKGTFGPGGERIVVFLRIR
ncbi:MAG TPA: hypothetical protein ENN41_02230 [Sediminispirochaeta sp.]|nr:hypothetical protein [Sediminispirochaeta sp.]